MPKLLTRLKIDEVSAVDAAAGENCKILLRKRDQDVVGKATAALKESVDSIIACDDDDETKRKALAETFAQFQYHLECNAAGGEGLSKGPLERGQRRLRSHFEKILGVGEADRADDVAKASRDRHDIGGKGLASATAELALDLIHHHRRRLGLVEKADTTKKESITMDNLTSISKSHDDLMDFCKRAVEDGEPGGVSENALVEAVTKHACTRFPNERSDVAFSKLWNASTPEGVLLRKTARLCRDGAWGYASA
jgi:hypothetical protein